MRRLFVQAIAAFAFLGLAVLGAESPPPTRAPEAIVRDTCILCHGPGIGGAPRRGDTKAWSKRGARGLDALVRSAADGRGAMPPRGGMADLTDEELRGAVAYLSGALPIDRRSDAP